MSGTTRVSRYQKKHSPTHNPDHHPIFISFFHLLRSIASSVFKLHAWQSFCTTSLHVLYGLPVGLEPSTLYSIHFFTQPASSFRNTWPYHNSEPYYNNIRSRQYQVFDSCLQLGACLVDSILLTNQQYAVVILVRQRRKHNPRARCLRQLSQVCAVTTNQEPMERRVDSNLGNHTRLFLLNIGILQDMNSTTTTTTTVLRPFFRDHPNELVPGENFWTLWCNGRLTEADTPTIQLAATPSRLCSSHLHHPHVFLQSGCPSCRPTNSVKAVRATITFRT